MEHQVIVTLGDVWDELREQKEILNTILSRLDVMTNNATNQGERIGDHEKRLRELERRVWALPSVATVIAVVSLLWNLWKKYIACILPPVRRPRWVLLRV